MPTIMKEVVTVTYLLWVGPFFSIISHTPLTTHTDTETVRSTVSVTVGREL